MTDRKPCAFCAKEHTEIWLSPPCDRESNDGRLWAPDNPFDPCPECGAEAVRFVRSDRAATASKPCTYPAWQPIETAPRDGTRLWCFWPDAWPEDRQAIGWFVSGAADEYWTDAADSEPNPPTHWMPLPAAPDQPEDPAHD